MRTSGWVLASSSIAIALLTACGSSDSSGAGVDVGTLETELCQARQTCCEAEKRPSTVAGCVNLYRGFTAGPTDAVSRCDATIKARVADGTFCLEATTVGFIDPCADAILPPEALPPVGADCTSAVACAATETGGTVVCAVGGPTSARTATCAELQTGSLGQGPCKGVLYAGGFDNDQFLSGPTVAKSVYACDASAGLLCDDASEKCVAGGAPGDPCGLGGPLCNLDTASCDQSSMKCVGLLALGAACTDPASVCGGAASCVGGVCKNPVPIGGACTADGDCSAFIKCTGGVCTDASAFTISCIQ